MNQQLLYLQDPHKLEFEANIVGKLLLPGERNGVILDRSYFYPTGGGQEHDTGQINEAKVLDVFKDAHTSKLIHILDRELFSEPVKARIDADRRIRSMQHHTAQHLLTQCFLRQLNVETVSANINAFNPSTIDLDSIPIQKSDLEQVEDLANSIIFQNLLVKSYFVSRAEIDRVPIRRVSPDLDDIRIIEIDSFDYSACAGTHCTHTGSIGLIKIVKSERQNEKTRIHFVAGLQALDTFRMTFDTVSELASFLSVHPQELGVAVRRQAQELKSAQKDLLNARIEKVAGEAPHLLQHSQVIQHHRCILKAFENRPLPEIRNLATELKQHSQTIAVLLNASEDKISLVVSCSPDSRISAQDLLSILLQEIGGRGAGDRTLAQGGGLGSQDQVTVILNTAAEYLSTHLL